VPSCVACAAAPISWSRGGGGPRIWSTRCGGPSTMIRQFGGCRSRTCPAGWFTLGPRTRRNLRRVQ
jgi:hypothetical protein